MLDDRIFDNFSLLSNYVFELLLVVEFILTSIILGRQLFL